MAAENPSPSEGGTAGSDAGQVGAADRVAGREDKCPSCSTGFKTPLACGTCGILMQDADTRTPFALLGLEPSMTVDAADLKKRLKSFTRLVHPDFFATDGPEKRALAERNNARLNEAYDVVSSPVRRADWLLRHLGGPTEKELGDMPQAFLMEVMEWNETLDDSAPGSPELEELGRTLHAEREAVLGRIEAALTPLPPPGDAALADVRRSLNALRYLDRALSRAAG